MGNPSSQHQVGHYVDFCWYFTLHMHSRLTYVTLAPNQHELSVCIVQQGRVPGRDPGVATRRPLKLLLQLRRVLWLLA